MERLGPCTTTTEAGEPRARALQQKKEATAVGGPCAAAKSGPRSLQLERARAQRWGPNKAKNKNK